MALIEREPCYIYSMREYQEHSLILEAISLNLGAIAILARGAKRPDSPLQGLFQPFTPLLLSLQLGQKGDLYYLKDYEYCPGGYHFVIPESFCAFYLNELLHLLYHGKESDKLLFGHYIATLEAIEHKDNIEHHLRSFELHLLKSLGYAISPLDEQGEPVKADQSYRFCFGIGFVEVDPEFMAQVMRSQSQKTTAAPAPVPQPEPDAENAMLFAKSKIRGPKMAESRPSQAPGQEAWVKRALEQGFSSSVIQRYYEYGADLLGPILTGAEIQDIVSLECKLPHSAHNAKLLTASVINRLTGGVELNSRKLYREYLHLCKQKQAAAQAPAPAPAAPTAPGVAPAPAAQTAPGAAPAPAPAIAPAGAPAPSQVVAPMAPAPQPAASAVAAPAPSTVPTEPQMTAPVTPAGPETNPEPETSLETGEPKVESEQVAGADMAQASQDESVAASPELETEATSSLETSATAFEGESEGPVETEANPASEASLETAEPAVEAEQVAGAEFAQESQDETVAASPELETEATSSLETSSTAAEGESEAPAEPETTPTLETSLETAEPVVEAEQVAGADMAQVSQEVTVEASTDAETEATSSLETNTAASGVNDAALIEPEASAEPTAKAKKGAKSAKGTSAKGRKSSTAQTSVAKRKSKTPDLNVEPELVDSKDASEEAQALTADVSESSEAPAKPKRSTKAKSGKSAKAKSTSAKGTKASSKRSARQRAAEVAGTVESSQQDEPEPEVITQGPEIEALDDELLVLAPQVIEPEVPATPVKTAKKVKKLTRAQLKAKAKAEAEALALAEQERMATSPYDESMLMTLDASLTKRRRKKPAAKQ